MAKDLDDLETFLMNPGVAPDQTAFVYLPGQSVGYLVRDANRLFGRNLQDKIASAGVLLGHWYFLRVLWEDEGLTQRELSERVGMKESTTFTALTSMERNGLIRRSRNETDRRKVNVFLTPKGKALKAKLLPLAKDVNEIATQDFSADEVKQLRTLLERVRRNLDTRE